MRRSLLFTIVFFILVLGISSNIYAFGLEAAVGAWKQSPAGKLAFEALTIDDVLDLNNDLNYDDETRIFGRLKIDMPLFIPNIYPRMKWNN